MGRQTTITLDEDVAAKLESEAERTGVTPDDIVNGALRKTLPEAPVVRRALKVRPRNLGVPLIDLDCTGRVLEFLAALEQK